MKDNCHTSPIQQAESPVARVLSEAINSGQIEAIEIPGHLYSLGKYFGTKQKLLLSPILGYTDKLRVVELGSSSGALTQTLSEQENIELWAYEPNSYLRQLTQTRIYRSAKSAGHHQIVTCLAELKRASHNKKAEVVVANRIFSRSEFSESFLTENIMTLIDEILDPQGLLLIIEDNPYDFHHLWFMDRLPQSGSRRGISKSSLFKILEHSHFIEQQWLFPYPDLSQPLALLNEDLFSSSPIGNEVLGSEIKAATFFPWQRITQLAQFQDTSSIMPGFLVLASKRKDSALLAAADRRASGVTLKKGESANAAGQVAMLVDDLIQTIHLGNNIEAENLIRRIHNDFLVLAERPTMDQIDGFFEFSRSNFSFPIYSKSRLQFWVSNLEKPLLDTLFILSAGNRDASFSANTPIAFPLQLFFDQLLLAVSRLLYQTMPADQLGHESQFFFPGSIWQSLSDLDLINEADYQSAARLRYWFDRQNTHRDQTSAFSNETRSLKSFSYPPEQLSVLIVTYNSIATIADCLNSLRLALPTTPIMVIDNHSTDSTVELLKRFDIHRLVLNEHNLLLSPAWNQGLKEISAQYVLLLNPDVVITDPTFIERSLAEFAKDPLLAITGKVIPQTVGGLATWVGPLFPEHRLIFHDCVLKSKWLKDAREKSSELPGDLNSLPFTYVEGCAAIIDRKKVLQIGGFSTQLPLYFNDAELSLRLHEASLKWLETWNAADGSLLHFEQSSSRKQTFIPETTLPPRRYVTDKTVSCSIIILPSGDPLQRSLCSVYGQTHSSWEVFRSGADSAGYEFDPADSTKIGATYTLSPEDFLSQALAKASADMICIVRPGSILSPNYLEKIMAELKKSEDLSIAYSNWRELSQSDRLPTLRTANLLQRELLVSPPTLPVFCFRSNCKQTPIPDFADDELLFSWNLLLNLSQQGRSSCIKEPLVDVWPASATGNHITTDHWSKLMTLNGQTLEISDLYPEILKCLDREKAIADALLDLGTSMLESDHVPLEDTEVILSQALSAARDSEIALANLTLCLFKQGKIEANTTKNSTTSHRTDKNSCRDPLLPRWLSPHSSELKRKLLES